MPTKKGSDAAKKAWQTIRAKKSTLGNAGYKKECTDSRNKKALAKKEKEEQEEAERQEALRILEEMEKKYNESQGK